MKKKSAAFVILGKLLVSGLFMVEASSESDAWGVWLGVGLSSLCFTTSLSGKCHNDRRNKKWVGISIPKFFGIPFSKWLVSLFQSYLVSFSQSAFISLSQSDLASLFQSSCSLLSRVNKFKQFLPMLECISYMVHMNVENYYIISAFCWLPP